MKRRIWCLNAFAVSNMTCVPLTLLSVNVNELPKELSAIDAPRLQLSTSKGQAKWAKLTNMRLGGKMHDGVSLLGLDQVSQQV